MSLKRSSLFQNPDYLINHYLQLTPIFVSSLKNGTKKIPSYSLTLFFILILSPSLRKSPTLSLPDLIIYSPDCPQYIAYRISSKNLVLDQLMIP